MPRTRATRALLPPCPGTVPHWSWRRLYLVRLAPCWHHPFALLTTMPKRLGPLAPLLAVLLLANCAGGAEPVAFEQSAAAEMARHPAWYGNGESRAFLVSRDGQPRAVLWGTMHVSYSGDTVLPRAIRDRFGEASDLTVEFALDRMAPTDRRVLAETMQKVVRTPDPAALARLDAATRAALDDSLPAGSAGRFSLTGLTYLLAARALADTAGPLPQMGFVDLNLMGFARNRGIPVHGLEQPAVQVAALLQDPNGADAAANLRQALRRQRDAREFSSWVRSSYGRGRVAEAVAALTAWQADPDDLARAGRQRQAVLADRNAAWVPKMETILAIPGLHFMAFGAGHLTGEDGVVALLRRRGWSVSPCPGDVCPSLSGGS